MENLTECNDSAFALNIVARPAQSPKHNAKKSKVKRNKFERRRHLHRLKQQETGKDIESRERNRTEISPVDIKAPSSIESMDNDFLLNNPTSNNADSSYRGEEEDNVRDSATKNSHTAQTRKHGIDDSNTEERARYLAEFHARPLELDRRARAARFSSTAQDSLHLFSDSASWSSSSLLHPRIIQTVESILGLKQPTLIQARSIPSFLRQQQDEEVETRLGNDSFLPQHNLLLQAETGSGKTLAFLLPILQSLAVDRETNELRKMSRTDYGTRCIILCPTRELAAQTAGVLESLCTHTFHWIVPGLLGGSSTNSTVSGRKSEKNRLRKGLGIIVATPGRLLDHLCKTESLLMALKGRLEWVVVDECDRLLDDMGLGDQVRQIMQHVTANDAGGTGTEDSTNLSPWRSVLVSATVTEKVKGLAKETFLGGNQPWVWVRGSERQNDDNQTNVELASATPRQLSQCVMTVSAKFRLSALVAFLVQQVQQMHRVVVFFDTCHSVDFHFKLFQSMKSIIDNDVETSGIFGGQCDLYKLHGTLPRNQRQMILDQFLQPFSRGKRNNQPNHTEGRAAILLSTDVAARGLNLKDCDWVVSYDPPSEISDYAHRAGRVARAGRAGHSLLFVLPSEKEFLVALKARGIPKLNALSLTSTLNAAAKICSSLSKEGLDRSGGGLGLSSKNTSRSGEAFCAELQQRLEKRLVEKEQKGGKTAAGANLLDMARNAYLSHIRAYPTREKDLKHIFAVNSLHLGHVARSFALTETPKTATKNFRGKQKGSEGQLKRSAAMAYGVGEGVDNDNFDRKKAKASVSPRINAKMMMENAKKLQSADAF